MYEFDLLIVILDKIYVSIFVVNKYMWNGNNIVYLFLYLLFGV